MSPRSRLRAVIVPATALALVATTLTALPATAATAPYLEPTVTLVDGRSAQPESFVVVGGSDTQVAVRLHASGTRVLSGRGLSTATAVPALDDRWNLRLIGSRWVAQDGNHMQVVDAATGRSTRIPLVGLPVGTPHATGWLEHGAAGKPQALVLVRLDGDTVTRQTIGDLPADSAGMLPVMSPSGRRVILRAGPWSTPVYLDVDVVAGTVKTITGEIGAIDVVADDAYIVTKPDGFTRERRGKNPTSWRTENPGILLWQGRTLEYGSYNGSYRFSEIAADGTRRPVESTAALKKLVDSTTRQVSDSVAWANEWTTRTLQQIDASGVRDVTRMPNAPLVVRAPDVTDGTVRWIDDSQTTAFNVGDVWARDLSGSGTRSMALRRATGRSLVVNDGRTYATRYPGEVQSGYQLVRTTAGADAQVLTTMLVPGRLSTAPGRVGVTTYPAGRIVDTRTGTTSAGPDYFQTVAGRWDVAADQIGPNRDTTRFTATSGSEKRVVDRPGFYSNVVADGTRVVAQTMRTNGFETTTFDLAGAASPTVKTLPVGPEEYVVTAGHGRLVTHDEKSTDLVVRSITDGKEVVRLRTGGRWEPVAALDGTWITWTVAGPDGDRLVAARLDGATTPSFGDVPAGHPFATEIGWLVEAGITEGYKDGTFGATAAVSRQAMAAFLYRAAGKPAFTAPKKASFSDVSTAHPFFREVEWLAASKVAGGYTDGTFRPTAPVSRQAMAAFLHRYADQPAVPSNAPTFPDVPAGNQFRDAIRWLASTKVTTGYQDKTFRPADAVSRQAMAAFLYRYDKLED